MRRILDILKWLLPLVVLLATACGHDDLVVPDEYTEELPTPYVEVRIAIPAANPSSTRANPMGGEEGNGRERGIENEDRIHDINVYFYNNEQGMNGEGDIDFHLFYNIKNPNDYLNTKVDSVLESNTKFGEKYLILKFQYWKEDGHISETNGMKFLAIANAGDLGNIATLKQLRDYVLSGNSDSSSTWQTTYDVFSKDASKMDYFLMTTAYNDEYFYNGQSTGDNTISKANNDDYIGTTTLQRMYARLDLWYNNSDGENNNVVKDAGNKIKELKYKVKDATSNTVYLTNVLPVNVMQKPSYLFKMVTKDVSSFNASSLSGVLDSKNYLWGGKENPFDGPYSGSSYNDLPTNYVMERHTLEKKTVDVINKMSDTDAKTYADGTLKDWYGNTRASVVADNSANASSGQGIKNSANGLLSGYYDMHRDPAGSDPTDYNCNHISIISYANENTHPTDCFHSNYLTGMAFRAVYVPDKIYSGLTETTDANGKTKVVATEWQMTDGTPTQIYRYSPTNRTPKEIKSLYFTDKDVAETYAKDHTEDMAIISDAYTAVKRTLEDGSEKWGFICYYNLWLRHYNDVDDTKTDPHPHLPMEYATVRNNIYRVSVSFTGPGDPTPSMREPDTMKARIFVRKWNYKEEPTINFEL